MNEPTEETILELIDKIIGYADNQPLILNHLQVVRQRVEVLEARASELELAAKNDDPAIRLQEKETIIAALHKDLSDTRSQMQANSEIQRQQSKEANPGHPSFGACG